jgi:hypothetical protein
VLAQAYVKAQQLAEAERLLREAEWTAIRIPCNRKLAQALCEMAETYAQVAAMVDGDQSTNLQQALLHFVQRHWLQATTNDKLTHLLLLAVYLLRHDSTNEIGINLVGAFDHVEHFWQTP